MDFVNGHLDQLRSLTALSRSSLLFMECREVLPLQRMSKTLNLLFGPQENFVQQRLYFQGQFESFCHQFQSSVELILQQNLYYSIFLGPLSSQIHLQCKSLKEEQLEGFLFELLVLVLVILIHRKERKNCQGKQYRCFPHLHYRNLHDSHQVARYHSAHFLFFRSIFEREI